MLNPTKGVETQPQPQPQPAAAARVKVPAVATVSAVDRAACQRAMVGGGRGGGEGGGRDLSAPAAIRGAGEMKTEKEEDTQDKKGREKIRDAIKSRRDDLRRRQEDEQDRLNCSLTTALCKSEAELIQKGSWMNEVKDLNGSFSKIPPISSKSKVGAKGQSFYVGMK